MVAQDRLSFHLPLFLRTLIVAHDFVNNSHKSSPYVLSKFRSVVIEKHPTLTEESLTRPVIESQQLKRTTTRNGSRRVCADDKPFQDAARPILRVARQELRNRLWYFHLHHASLN
jgi:hypothetical protein